MEAEFRLSEAQYQASFISFWILLSTFFWAVGLPVRCAKFGWFSHPDFAFSIHFIPIIGLGIFCGAIQVPRLKPYTYSLLCVASLCMIAWSMWSAHLLVQEEISMAVSGDLAGVFGVVRQNPGALAALRNYIVREQSRKYLWCEIITNFLQLNLLQFLGLTFASTAVFISLPVSLCILSYASRIMSNSTTEILIMSIIIVIYTCGLSYHMAKNRRRQFLLGYQLQRTLEKEAAALREAAQQEAALKEASQEADTILNHLLKNVMADAAGCIHLFLQTVPSLDVPPPDLVQATECLERGVAWCRRRQAILRMANGKYVPQLCDVDLGHFCRGLLQGRPIDAQFPDAIVTIDPMLCEVVLENALTNAHRHSHPQNPGLRFTASLTPIPGAVSPNTSTFQRQLTFAVMNRVHPSRPPLTPELVARLLNGEEMPLDSSSPKLSEHLGMQHLCQAARVHGMTLHLEQVGEEVRLEACLEVTMRLASSAPLVALSPSTSSAMPQNLRVFCIDDSPIARRLLIHTLSRGPLHASVIAFGETADEVSDFVEQALEAADIVILDYHLDYKHIMFRGTDLLRTLLDRGFQGLGCIRSSNVTPFDETMFTLAGAHCCIGKDVHPQAMITALTAAYLRLQQARRLAQPSFLADQVEDSPSSEPGAIAHSLPGRPLSASWKAMDSLPISPLTHTSP
eukprot:GGOE01011164.1.p1 GENE.GGOE01011164.1~~GGOE01011164.1.p1  ORF type:complete len:716 (-),score=171.62 GGOE01011164.1:322-2370(-)